jgi:hypothetical protein
VWCAIAVGGLVVGVIALSSVPGRDGSDSPAARLLVDLPEALGTLAAVAGSLALLLWFAFLLALARRRRRQDPQTGRTMWGTLLFALIVTAFAMRHRHLPEGLLTRWPGSHGAADWLPAAPSIPAPSVAMPLFTGAVGALVVIAALAGLGLTGWFLFGDRVAGWWGRSAAAARGPLVRAVDESLDDLHGALDPRLAIMRCYRRFEEALARARVPRAPWQTPLEFMRDALARLPLPPPAVERLTRLFERARFSDEPLAAADRDSAWSALGEIRRSLEVTDGDGRTR